MVFHKFDGNHEEIRNAFLMAKQYSDSDGYNSQM